MVGGMHLPRIHPYCVLNIDKLRLLLPVLESFFTAVLSTVVHETKRGGGSAPLDVFFLQDKFEAD